MEDRKKEVAQIVDARRYAKNLEIQMKRREPVVAEAEALMDENNFLIGKGNCSDEERKRLNENCDRLAVLTEQLNGPLSSVRK